VPTGPNFYSLDTVVIKDPKQKVENIIDAAFVRIVELFLERPDKTVLYFSSDPENKDRLGTGIFQDSVGKDVIEYISELIPEIPNMVKSAAYGFPIKLKRNPTLSSTSDSEGDNPPTEEEDSNHDEDESAGASGNHDSYSEDDLGSGSGSDKSTGSNAESDSNSGSDSEEEEGSSDSDASGPTSSSEASSEGEAPDKFYMFLDYAMAEHPYIFCDQPVVYKVSADKKIFLEGFFSYCMNERNKDGGYRVEDGQKPYLLETMETKMVKTAESKAFLRYVFPQNPPDDNSSSRGNESGSESSNENGPPLDGEPDTFK